LRWSYTSIYYFYNYKTRASILKVFEGETGMAVYIIAQQVYDLENWLLSKLVSYTLIIIIDVIANLNITPYTPMTYYTRIILLCNYILYIYFYFKFNNFSISNKIHYSPVDFFCLLFLQSLYRKYK